MSGSYAPSDIYQALVSAGIPSTDAATLTQVAGAESNYGANPVGTTNANGTTDYGIFQINSGAWPQLNPSSLVSAPLSTQAADAATVYNQQGLGAWATYNSGAYQGYASGMPTSVSSSPPASGSATATQTSGSGASFNPATWLPALGNWFATIAARAGLFILALLFNIGAIVLFGLKSGIEINSGPE